jgi:hypothetical protein
MSRSSRLVLVVLALAATISVAPSMLRAGTAASCTLPTIPGSGGLADTWVVDGDSIEDIVIVDGVAYLAGQFEVVGPPTGPAAEVDLLTGAATSTFPLITGPDPRVTAVTGDGAGGWYLAGLFTAVDGVARNGLARVRADGTVDPDFDPGVNDLIEALLLHDGVLYAGGEFTTIGGASRSFLAALDPVTGAATAWNPAPNDRVLAITADGGTVFVGGWFGTVGGAPRVHVAALDAATGAATTWTANISGGNRVKSLAIAGPTLFVGGSFTSIGGISRNNVAGVDVATGAVTSFDAGMLADDDVLSLAASGDTLYVGGRFETLDGGTPRQQAGAFSISTGNLTAWDPGPDGNPEALVATPDAVYLGGGFASIGGAERLGLAAVDPVTGVAQPLDLAATFVHSISVDGTRLAVGGSFQAFGGERRVDLAAVDLATGDFTDWAPVVDTGGDSVSALAVSGGTLYVGGEFNSVNGEARDNIAAIDLATGATLPWNPGADGPVFDLEADGGSVYAAGAFFTIGGESRSGLAEIDATSGMVTGWAPGVVRGDPGFSALAVGSTAVYAVGEDGSPTAFDRGTAAGTGWAPTVDDDGGVGRIFVDGSEVLLGGWFELAGGQVRPSLAAVDGVSGAVTGWNPQLPTFSFVRDIVVDGDAVWIAGEFPLAARGGGSGADTYAGVAAVDRTTGGALPVPDTLGDGSSIALSPSVLAVGGRFLEMGRGGLLLYCRDVVFDDGFESGDTDAWSSSTP